jgi:FAD/FMN-containing dehydrogenase
VNWIGEYSCGSSVAIHRPKTLLELQKAVRESKNVRAAATGRSFNPFVCPKDNAGSVIDVREFKHAEILQLGDGRYAVTAEAGIEMGQLQNLLLANGLTLRIPPGNPGYSWGAVVANGCHNLGQSHAEDYLAVTFVTHDGSVREVNRGDTDWLAAGMSQGRLGVILNATIEVLPYRSFKWSAEQFDIPNMEGIIEGVDNLGKNVTSTEQTSAEREVATGNKLVFLHGERCLSEGILGGPSPNLRHCTRECDSQLFASL